jgi:hypothetical protein
MDSMRRMPVLLLASVLTVAAAAVPVQAALAGPARAPRPGQWTQVTGKLLDISDVGLARGRDGVLHVLWTTGGTGTFRVSDTPIKANGVVGRPVTLQSHIFTANDPDATATSTGLAVFWNEVKSSTPNSTTGTFEATRPSRGGSWRISAITPIPFDWQTSLATASGTGGSPWTAFGSGGGDDITVDHVGHPASEFGFPNCCVTNEGIGTDSKAGTAFVTYASTVTRRSGLFAQRLTAAGRRSGAPILLPGSDIGGSPLVSNQRITATGLGGNRPGVYITYRSGPSVARDVELYRIGARRAVRIATFDDSQALSGSTLTADPFGRLWVAWFRGQNNSFALWVRRAKTGASQFGQVKRVGLPKRTSAIWKIYINAQARKLDIVALLTVRGKVAYWTTQVLPPKQ